MPALTAPVPVSIAQLINNHARLIEQRDKMLDILRELVSDVERNGIDKTCDEWFDIYVTYEKAKALVSR